MPGPGAHRSKWARAPSWKTIHENLSAHPGRLPVAAHVALFLIHPYPPRGKDIPILDLSSCSLAKVRLGGAPGTLRVTRGSQPGVFAVPSCFSRYHGPGDATLKALPRVPRNPAVQIPSKSGVRHPAPLAALQVTRAPHRLRLPRPQQQCLGMPQPMDRLAFPGCPVPKRPAPAERKPRAPPMRELQTAPAPLPLRKAVFP